MKLYVIGVAYFASGINHCLSVARCQSVEFKKEERRCR
jgi:hypothetical protein